MMLLPRGKTKRNNNNTSYLFEFESIIFNIVFEFCFMFYSYKRLKTIKPSQYLVMYNNNVAVVTIKALIITTRAILETSHRKSTL